jgi:hypothetical protein
VAATIAARLASGAIRGARLPSEITPGQ